jgi:hypothetical protein
MFWMGLGATLGAAATRKVTQLRSQFTWQTALKALAISTPGVLNSLRSIVLNLIRTAQAAKKS